MMALPVAPVQRRYPRLGERVRYSVNCGDFASGGVGTFVGTLRQVDDCGDGGGCGEWCGVPLTLVRRDDGSLVGLRRDRGDSMEPVD